MSILTYPLGFIGGGKEFYNGVIENSLRSNHAENMYLQRTPSAASNRRTFTLSVWVKKGRIGDTQAIFSSEPDGGNLEVVLKFNSDDTLWFSGDENNTADWQYKTTQVFRDVGSWYHIVAVVDTPNSTSTERIKLFVNGKRITDFSTSTAPSQNYDTGWNVAEWHRIINFVVGTDNLGGYVTDIYSIDGYALGPENFGEYKEDVWIPKAYAGPPPIITDSSNSNYSLDSVSNKAGLNYDNYYIGETAIATKEDYFKVEPNTDWTFLHDNTQNYTVDFWIYSPTDPTSSNIEILGTSGGSSGLVGTHITFDSGDNTLHLVVANGSSGNNVKFKITTTSAIQNAWHQVTIIYNADNNETANYSATKVDFYLNGVKQTVTRTFQNGSSFAGPNTGAPTYELRLFSLTGSVVRDVLIDEFRIIKDKKPPRFYFGTTYGDASGGVLPQRATSAHRFTDDERTTLLVSGQSANGHARAVSLVDESGFHTDNVHFSNSTFTAYPTQDGVGHQFTISGPQNTTRESFVGNTSSIVLDTTDDRVEVTGPTVDGLPFTIDMWLKPGELAADWNEVIGFNTSTGSSASYLNYYGAATPDYIELYTGSSNTQRSWYLEGFDAQNWHHIALVRNSTTETDIDFYLDGHKAAVKGTEGSFSGNITGTHFEFGQREMTRSMQYYDEIRVVQSADKPQIKWTHTQTAGAGNKDAYDIHGWRAHGHEFSDDNATSLLVHGDNAYIGLKRATSFDGTDDYARDSDFPVPSGTSPRTIAVWSWMNQSTDSPEGYIMSAGNNSPNEDFAFIVNNQLAFSAWANDFTVLPDALTPIYQWIFTVATYDGTTTKVYYNGELHKSEADSLATPTSGCTLTIAASDAGSSNYACYISNAGIWNRDLSAAEVKDLFLKGAGGNWTTDGPNGDYSASNNSYRTGSMSGTNTPDTTGLIGWWAFGNHDDIATGAYSRTTSGANATGGSADTGSIIYDRSGHNKNLSDNNGISAPGGVPATFRDSSSANSIHHALVSGGGIHHTKAVTLKSDGTNGTSTTDEHGNTIYWCGSNSTVTFANSSSFDYGNTSFFHSANNTLHAGTSPDWDLAAQFTVSMWVHISSTQTGHATHGLFSARGDGYEGPTGNVTMSGGQAKVRFIADEDNAGPWHTILDTSLGDFPLDSWNFVEYNRDANNLLTISVNGVVKASETNSQDFYYSGTHNLQLGRTAVTDSENQAMTGYMDEFMYMVGGNTPSRFYLGNQAPEANASFTTVKAHNFDGTDDYMTTGGAGFGDTNSNRSFAAWIKFESGETSGYYLGNMNTSDYENSFFIMNLSGTSLRVASHFASSTTMHYNDTTPLILGELQHLVVQYPDSSSGTINVYINGKLVTENGTLSSGSWGSGVGDNGITVGRVDSGNYGDMDIKQIAFFEGSSAHHSAADVKAMYDLGPTGNLNTSYSTGMVAYYGFGNLDAVNVTGGTATADTVSTVYDRKASGTAVNLTQSTASYQPTQSTFYYPSNSAKRLTHGPLLYTANPTSNTAILGNTHYANTKPQSVTAATFGSFVDDEYTVLLLRGGHAVSNTVFFDGNTAAGATITFPAHSHSYGKTRQAKKLVGSGTRMEHNHSYELGLHGTSILFDGSDDYITIPAADVSDDFKVGGPEGSFCWEWFARNQTGTITERPVFSWGSGSGKTIFYYSGALKLEGSGTNLDLYTFTLPQDEWHHYAFQGTKGSDGVVRYQFFYDGVCVSNQTRTDDQAFGPEPGSETFYIGYKANSGSDWLGYLDEIRFTKGIPRYTPDGASVSGIVPGGSVGYAGVTGSSIPTSPYLRPTPYVATDGGRGYFANSNVKLWVKSDTYPGDTNFYDSAGTIGNTPKAITNVDHTAANRPLIKTANSISDYALSGGADGIYLDGSNDTFYAPEHEDFNMGTGDFTIEGWFNFHNIADNKGIFSLGGPASINSTGHTPTWHNAAGTFGIRWSGTGIQMKANGSTVASPLDAVASGTHGITTNTWHHIVTQRLDGQISLFINGVSMGTVSNTSNLTKQPFYLGYYSESPYYGGFTADEVRVSKMARYTGQGLIDSDYPNPSTEFGIQTEGTTYGRFDTQVTANTTYQRYNYQHDDGWKSYVFDGTNDKVDWGDQVDFSIGDASTDGDFSIAAWVNFTSDPADYEPFLGKWNNSEQWTKEWLFRPSTSNKWEFRIFDASANATEGIATTYETITIGEWTLVVGTLDSSGTTYVDKMDIYLNGYATTKTALTIGSYVATENTTATLELGNLTGTSGGYGGPFRISNLAIWKGRTLTASEVKEMYLLGPAGNWKTTYGTSMVLYNTFGNHDTLTVANADTASALYDRSGSPSTYNASTVSGVALNSDTKLLIHSNTDIDGDTSIVDSSASEHSISRVVNDPQYANTGVNRSSLAGATYNGVRMNPSGITSAAGAFSGLQVVNGDYFDFGSGNFTMATWAKRTSTTNRLDLAGQLGASGVIEQGFYWYQGPGDHIWYWRYRNTDGNRVGYSYNAGSRDENWHHYCVTRDGSTFTMYIDGSSVSLTTEVAIGSTTLKPLGTDTTAGSFSIGQDQNTGVNPGPDGILDQFFVIKGAALTSTQVTSLRGGGNANTTIGALGGLIVHEEYANTTTTANASTPILLHSNNATHHSQGSRKFYNDIANTKFYGAGTFSATPAAAPKGHEAAGYFVVTAASGQYKFQGNTHSSTIDQNPQLRLRRGYSYIFDFSDATNSGHEFYFANSTANSTGYAYGSGGTSGARPNAHLTGLFGTNTDPNGAPAVTWTQLTATNYGDNSGTGDAYTYIKYEVPTDAPKNLYYRCSPHSTMGNAVFVMEATEPPAVKVGNLPALKTSGWNDRDYNPSKAIVMNNTADTLDIMRLYGHTHQPRGLNIPKDESGTGNVGDNFNFGTGDFAVGGWINPTLLTTGANIQLWGNLDQNANYFWESGNDKFQIRVVATGVNNGRFQLQCADSSSQTAEAFFVTGMDMLDDTWKHFIIGRSGTTFVGYFNGKAVTATSTSGTLTTALGGTNYGMQFGSKDGGNNNGSYCGFANELFVYNGTCPTAAEAVDIYMRGRVGASLVANSALKLYITSKSTDAYGSGVLYDSSGNNWNMRNEQGEKHTYHHIEDDRTANTALYFDGTSKIEIPWNDAIDFADSAKIWTFECWAKYTGTATEAALLSWGQDSSNNFLIGINTNTKLWVYSVISGSTKLNTTTAVGDVPSNVWNHIAICYYGPSTNRDASTSGTSYDEVKMFVNGVCIAVIDSNDVRDDQMTYMSSGESIGIGYREQGSTADSYHFTGFLDGIRITDGMERYTSGIPADGQSPAKDYDDGRSSNVSSNTWATSSTRRYYGINTHTYLQTTEYATDANTVLLIRGDDAQTANDGVNMYGNNGFHLEFKEVGAGEERDYNNFGTGVAGLGSDTSATQEFTDDATVLLVRSRPNQANGSAQFVDETNQDTGTVSGTAYHSTTKTIFGIDSNTANVSIASGGSGTY